MGLAQLERIDELVGNRQKCAAYFLDAISGCHFLIPQKVPQGYVNSYYTFSAKYLGERPTAYRQVFLNQTSEKSPTELKFLPPLSQVKAEINYRFDSKWQSYLRAQYNIGSIKSKWDYYLLNQNLFLGGIRYSFDLAF